MPCAAKCLDIRNRTIQMNVVGIWLPRGISRIERTERTEWLLEDPSPGKRVTVVGIRENLDGACEI
jgi:hypothetical protein